MQSWQASLVNLALRLTMKTVTNLTASVKYTRLFGQALDTINKPLVTLKSMKITPVKIPHAEFDAEWIDMPSSDDDRVILYLPGGGFITRTPHIHRGMVSRFCKEANVRALMVYYRLAPENPYPAALNDACAAYRWLLSQGYDPQKIIIAGDSAGGGLTLSTLIRLRDEKEQLPAGGFMISPGVDLSHQSPSRWKNGDKDVMFARPGRLKLPFHLYLAKNQDINDPAVSPINAEFDGLPPLYVQVSNAEIVLDDCLRVAKKGHKYNVTVNIDVWHNVPHVWSLFPVLPESAEAAIKAAAFINEVTLPKQTVNNISSPLNSDEDLSLSTP